MYFLIFQRLFAEAILDIFAFPVWWYTKGTVRAFLGAGHMLSSGNSRLAPGLWLKNIFVPMYAQRDWQGRVISFFARVAEVAARTVLLLLWSVVCALLFLFWLAVPIAVVFGFVYSLRP